MLSRGFFCLPISKTCPKATASSLYAISVFERFHRNALLSDSGGNLDCKIAGMHNGAIQRETVSNETGTPITFGMRSGQFHCWKCAVCAFPEIIRLPACVWHAMEKAALSLQLDSKA